MGTLLQWTKIPGVEDIYYRNDMERNNCIDLSGSVDTLWENSGTFDLNKQSKPALSGVGLRLLQDHPKRQFIIEFLIAIFKLTK